MIRKYILILSQTCLPLLTITTTFEHTKKMPSTSANTPDMHPSCYRLAIICPYIGKGPGPALAVPSDCTPGPRQLGSGRGPIPNRRASAPRSCFATAAPSKTRACRSLGAPSRPSPIERAGAPIALPERRPASQNSWLAKSPWCDYGGTRHT